MMVVSKLNFEMEAAGQRYRTCLPKVRGIFSPPRKNKFIVKKYTEACLYQLNGLVPDELK
jgi:hypothetical protein